MAIRVKILPYKTGSKSAKALAEAAKVRRLKLVNTAFVPKQGDIIINWGSAEGPFNEPTYDESLRPRSYGGMQGSDWHQPAPRNPYYLNAPDFVAQAQNKLHAFRVMHAAGVIVPEFTESSDTAQRWVNANKIVVCRSLLRGSAGRGIGLVGREIEDGDHTGVVPPCKPLYTMYVPKYDEFRVHVWQGRVLDVQQKKRKRDNENVDQRIRSHANGWVFCREDIEVPDKVIEQAHAAVAALRLDFGAVDIGWTRKTSTATVYEVNTAPGLEGTTLEKYAEAVRALKAG